VRGAYLNVLINASGLEDKAWAADIIAKAETLMNNAIASEKEVMDIVLGVIKG
jgi:glutamate formiminotransferase/formiminotetrahydrofolate cyclodeaminase